jgi:2,4-dienoyl-CoA reductase-like NADH-dependent reductase (Old Yellow Enzyme family)
MLLDWSRGLPVRGSLVQGDYAVAELAYHNTEIPDVLSPAQLGPIALRNRTIKAATYENMARNGLVTDELVAFHVAHARGGVAMTTVAYCAVDWDGRTDGEQIVWRPEAVPGLRRLTDAVHEHGCAASAQIGHSGPCGNPKLTGHQALSPTRRFNPASGKFTRPATIADLDRVVAAHATAARMAIEAGFDAVEIHLGHNYLASSFLSSRLNKRRDEYGGSLENRARLTLRITHAVREEVGDRIAVLAKLNMDDGMPGGFGLDEATRVSQWLQEAGSVDALEMTVGSSLENMMYLFRGDVPMKQMRRLLPRPQRIGLKIVGKKMLRTYPYEDGYLLADARRIRAAVDLPMILLGGITNAATMDRAMAEGFEFVAMGRALLREPDLINRLSADRSTPSLCDHNNECAITTFYGTHCPLATESTPS